MPKKRNSQSKQHAPKSFAPAGVSPREVWVIAAVALLTTLAYLPSIRGGELWDDNAHITKPELRSLNGLYSIWFEPGATQQYYPLLYSAFWVEQELWGDATLGYHSAQLLQHIAAATLVWLILATLKVPGAVFAAAIFALHPVQVESVAWMSEQKNTLSAVFYLGAMLAYLKFDETRSWRIYALAFGLFLLGLMTKTVTASLPAAVIVLLWWKRRNLTWRQDILPLVPFFVFGAIAGLTTALFERKIVGAEGAEFELSLMQRGLIAGRAIWFYIGKLIWPTNLIFIYPRWAPDPTVWWQWLFPIAAIAATVGLWFFRNRWRAPLAGWLFFVGTLFPVLGFLNIWPFLFSFVADHFQYLACLGIIVLAASGVAILIARGSKHTRVFGNGLCILLVLTLAALTWNQSKTYRDLETLYRSTLERNPDCWMVAGNLGKLLLDAGQDKDAIGYFEQALRIKPDDVDAHNGLGVAYANTGQLERALEQYKAAIKIADNSHEAHNNLGNLLTKSGNLPDAIEQYRQAIRWNDKYALAHNGLGNALRLSGDVQGAIAEFNRAVELDPKFGRAYMNLGIALFSLGKTEEGIEKLRKAVEVEPNYPESQNNLANALANTGHIDESFKYFEAAIKLNPDYAIAHLNLANALVKAGRQADATAHYQRVLQLNPDNHSVYANLVLTYAALNKAEEAIQTAEHAIQITRAAGETALASQLEAWLEEYRTSHSTRR